MRIIFILKKRESTYLKYRNLSMKLLNFDVSFQLILDRNGPSLFGHAVGGSSNIGPLFRIHEFSYLPNEFEFGIFLDHPGGRSLASDWSVNSVLIIVYEKLFSVVLSIWTDNSDKNVLIENHC